MSRLRRVPAPEGSTCGACGEACDETDRGLVVMHRECIRQIKDVVAREGWLNRGERRHGGERRG